MALVDCVECGRRISDRALSCPQCGHPRPAKSASLGPNDYVAVFAEYLENLDEASVGGDCVNFLATAKQQEQVPLGPGLLPFGVTFLYPEFLAFIAISKGTNLGQRFVEDLTAALSASGEVNTIRRVGKWLFGSDNDQAWREGIANKNSFALPVEAITGIEVPSGFSFKGRFMKLTTRYGGFVLCEPPLSMGLGGLASYFKGKAWQPEAEARLRSIVARNRKPQGRPQNPPAGADG